MALIDPQIITVNSVAKSMPKIPGGAGTSTLYQINDMTFGLLVKHTSFKQDKKSRIKSLAQFTQRAVVADPLTAVNDYETVTISFQIDRPEVGFTATQVDQMVAGLKTWLDTTMVTKLYGRES